MRKMILVLLFSVVGLSVFPQSGVIRELSGTVEYKTAQAAAYAAAKTGDLIAADTAISTGFKSSALIEVGSALLMVRPLTRLTLTEIRASQGTETINVNLQAGRVRVDLNPPAGTKASLSVASHVATASVRGTSFEMDTVGLYVIEGVVGYEGNRGGLVYVHSGFESKATAKGNLSNPYGNIRAGFPPMTPVGYDPLSAPLAASSAALFTPTPGTPIPPAPPGPSGPGTGGGGGSSGSGGGGSGGGSGGGDGDVGGIVIDSW